MGIFSRTRDIIAANVTDLLDKAEDPAKMIRMIILEMEETLVEVRASAARTIADQKEMRRQITKLERLQDSWVEKAELALSKGRDDLAKAALFEKQKAADMADQLNRRDRGARRRAALVGNRHRQAADELREARARQNAVMTRMESAQNRSRLREMYSGPKIDDAFSRFDVLERHADLAEGHAEALGLGGPPKSLDDEIAELRNADKVDAELEALKAPCQAHQWRRSQEAGGLSRWIDLFHPDRRDRLVFIGLPWLIFHYVTQWKTAATLTTEDENLLDELHELARRLDDRMSTIERIVQAENPDWRALGHRPGRGPARGPHRPALRSRPSGPAARRARGGNHERPRTKFYKDKQNAKWSGVCAGIADYTGIDVTLVRLGLRAWHRLHRRLRAARLLGSSPG